MPKGTFNFLIHLNLLKPQGEKQKIVANLLNWLLSAGRYIVIFIEIIVLSAFLLRFKLDYDIANIKEKIDEQIPFIQSLKSDETLIKKVQFQLNTIRNIRQEDPDFTIILKKVANQMPQNINVTNINMEKTGAVITFKIIGTSQNETGLATLILGLKEDKSLSNIDLASISIEQNLINFTINGKFITPTTQTKKS